jgi:hypothetical protein
MLLKSHWFFSNCQFDKISELVPRVSDRKGMKRAKSQSGFHNLTKERVAQTMQRIGWNTARLEALREQKQGPPRLQATDDILTAIHGNLFCSATHVATGTEDPSHVKPFSVGELNEAEDEAEQAAETYQTIVNAAMAIYNEMFEVRTIREKPFISLKASVCMAEEAIHGELNNHKFLEHDPELKGLDQKDADSQMEKAILVAWRYLLFKCTTKEGSFWKPFDLADKHFNLWRLRVKIEWKTMAKHVETLLVFIMAHEQLLTEMHVLKEMPAWSKLAETITRAKVEFLELFFGPGCSSREYEMFTCVQHVLAARSTLVKKVLVIFDHVRMGLLSNDAAKAIISNEVRPLMHELRAFVPTWRHIKVFIGGGKRPHHDRNGSGQDRNDNAPTQQDRMQRAVRRSSMLSQDHFDQTMNAAKQEMRDGDHPSDTSTSKRHVAFHTEVAGPSQNSGVAPKSGPQSKGAMQKVSEDAEGDWDCNTEDPGPNKFGNENSMAMNAAGTVEFHEDTETATSANGTHASAASKKKPKKKPTSTKAKARPTATGNSIQAAGQAPKEGEGGKAANFQRSTSNVAGKDSPQKRSSTGANAGPGLTRGGSSEDKA